MIEYPLVTHTEKSRPVCYLFDDGLSSPSPIIDSFVFFFRPILKKMLSMQMLFIEKRKQDFLKMDHTLFVCFFFFFASQRPSDVRLTKQLEFTKFIWLWGQLPEKGKDERDHHRLSSLKKKEKEKHETTNARKFPFNLCTLRNAQIRLKGSSFLFETK